MGTVEAAIATQPADIERRTGKSLTQLVKRVKASGLTKNGEIRDHLKARFELGYGEANALTHHALKSGGATTRAEPSANANANVDDALIALQADPKAALRPIQDALMAKINAFGEFETSPKNTYLTPSRSDPGSSLCSTRPRNHSQTCLASRCTHRLLRWPATASLSQTPSRQRCPST